MTQRGGCSGQEVAIRPRLVRDARLPADAGSRLRRVMWSLRQRLPGPGGGGKQVAHTQHHGHLLRLAGGRLTIQTPVAVGTTSSLNPAPPT